LFGLTPIVATTGGGFAAFKADVQALGNALARAGSGSDIVFIMAPEQALSAALQPAFGKPLTIWSSLALSAGTIIAIEPAAFISAFGPDARIDASAESVINFEDTNPAQIGTPPNIVAAPTLSAFQSDMIVIRLLLEAAWTMRGPGYVAFLTGATW
jgi:hypothetical protein